MNVIIIALSYVRYAYIALTIAITKDNPAIIHTFLYVFGLYPKNNSWFPLEIKNSDLPEM